MAEISFAERMRTAHVTRFQIVRTARAQTLAEHLYLVRVITMEMCTQLNLTAIERQVAQEWALEHDVPEVRTGDLATPVKAAMREAVPHDDPIRRIELSYSDSYSELYRSVKNNYPHIQAMVKMADTLEASMFLSIEGMGAHAREVQVGLWTAFNEQVFKAAQAWPQFDWDLIYKLGAKHAGP